MELAVRPHIMSDRDAIRLQDIPSGTMTVQQAIDRMEFIDPRVRQTNLAVFIDGEVLPQDQWSTVIIDENNMKKVEIAAVLHGGSAKRILALVATIVVAVYAPQLALGILGAGAKGTFAYYALSAGIMMLGNLAINAIFRPPAIKDNTESAKGEASPHYGFGGQSNQIRPFQPLLKVLGRHRVVPDVAAVPYTINIGRDQFMYVVYSFGYGPLKLEDFKIGTVPLTNFKNYTINVIERFTHPSQLRLYKGDVWQDSYAMKINRATPATAVTRPDTEEAYLDIVFPNGLGYVMDNGGLEARSVRLLVEYSPNGVQWSRADLFFNSMGYTQQQWVQLEAPLVEEAHTQYGESGDYTYYRQVRRLGTGATSAGVKQWGSQLQTGGTQPPPAGTKLQIGSYTVTITSATASSVTWAEPLPGELTLDNAGTIWASFTSSAGSVGSPTAQGEWSFNFAHRGQFVAGISLRFPNKGAWHVRVSQLSDDYPDDGRHLWEHHFVALKSIKSIPPMMPEVPLTVVELAIKANDQLNGQLDNFSAIATSILPVWNGAAWVEQPTRNPAWIYLDLLCGVANRRRIPHSRIDLTKFFQWATYCNSTQNGGISHFSEPIGTCDVVIDRAYTLWELLQSVATCGRATPTMKDNKYSVLIDAQDRSPVQMFTPRNSWNLRSTRKYVDEPHALRVKWVDPQSNYGPAEITVYSPGYNEFNASKFEELPTFGMTRVEQVTRYGRYMLAQGKLRLERFTLETDIENIVCVRGDLVHVAHDVIEVGGEANRILAISADRRTITCDMDISLFDHFEQGVEMGIRIRMDTGQLTDVIGVANINRDLGTILITSPSLPAGVKVGDLFVYGQRIAVTGQYVVDKVVPNADMGAVVHLEEYAPAVYEAELTGNIPPYKPQGGGSYLGPPPQNVQVQLIEYRESRIDPSAVIRVSWSPPEGADKRPPHHYRIWGINAEGQEAFLGQVTGDSYTEVVSLYRFGGTARIYQVRAYHPAYGLSNPGQGSIILPQRSLLPPDPPSHFRVESLPNGTRRYQFGYRAGDLDFRPEGWTGVRIRHTTGTVPNPPWELMTDLLPGGTAIVENNYTTPLPTGQGPHTFSIRSVDQNGILSDRSTNFHVDLSRSALDGGGIIIDDSFPPNPGDFMVEGGPASIFFSEDAVLQLYPQGGGHDYTRVYYKEYQGGALPTFEGAQVLGTYKGPAGSLPARMNRDYRIWIKWVARNGKESLLPAGGPNGKPVRTLTNPDEVLDILEGALNESHLNASLNSRINLIDGDGPGSVNTRDRAWFDAANLRFDQQFTVHQDSINHLRGQYTVKIDLNGYVTGFGFAAENNNGQIVSEFVFRADRFFIGAPGAFGPGSTHPRPGYAPFTVITTRQFIRGEWIEPGVYMHEAFIRRATISTAHIINGNVTNAKIGNAIHSTGWNGSFDSAGFIRRGSGIGFMGSTGWAVDKAGTAVFNDMYLRQIRDADSGQVMSAVGLNVATGDFYPAAYAFDALLFAPSQCRLYGPGYHAQVGVNNRARGGGAFSRPVTVEVLAIGIVDHYFSLWMATGLGAGSAPWQCVAAIVEPQPDYGPAPVAYSFQHTFEWDRWFYFAVAPAAPVAGGMQVLNTSKMNIYSMSFQVKVSNL